MIKTEIKSTLNAAGTRWASSQSDNKYARWVAMGAILLQGALNILLAGEVIRAHRQAQEKPPIVVRLDGSGHASTYDPTYTPQARETQYYLAKWARLYYARIHSQVVDWHADSLLFAEPKFADELKRRTETEVKAFVNDVNANETEVDVSNVIVHLEKLPYRAEIHFTKKITATSGVLVSSENWITEVKFRMLSKIDPKHYATMIRVNPLGFGLDYAHESKGF